MKQNASVRDALRLRAAALDLLGGGAPDWTRLRDCSAATWQVFLRTERCALPLKSRLASAGAAVPDAIRATLERAATAELQRILSARGHLVRIGRLAAARGIAAIVLKGGVAALASAAPLDVHDADVLVRPDQAERLAALLDAEGFRSTGPAGSAHLAQRIVPHAVQIEVHFALQDVELSEAMWERVRPVDQAAGAAGLSRLGAADHLWHLLVHTVVTHPYRRGVLRDGLLAAEALGECTPGELREVQRRIAAHPGSRPLGALLTMAQQLLDGGPVRDAFRREAAANYLLLGPLAFRYSRFWSVAFVGALFAQLGGGDEQRREWALAWGPPQNPSPWGFAARLERRAPRLGRLCRNAVKVARLCVVRIATWPVALTARWLAR